MSRTRGRDLTTEQNERVRALVQRLLDRGDTQKDVGVIVGLRQPSLSSFIAGRTGTSYSVAKRAAKALNVDLDAYLEGRAPVPSDPFPIRAQLLALVGSEIHPAARDAVRSLVPTDPNMSALGWMKAIVSWDDLARRGLLPHVAQTRPDK